MSTSPISVMLTCHKRPGNFADQLAAVQAQTLKPQAISVYHNVHKDFPAPDFQGLPTITSSPNNGVWARFLACMEFTTEYVCVFDDDTIPGPQWFENCMATMHKQEGLLGTVGVIFKSKKRRPYWRWGWVRPSEKIQEVDLVGHSWFFKREWLQDFAAEPRRGASTCGEDYHFSVALQRRKILTYVPPHPPNNKALWGSTRGKLGRDSVALYSRKGEEEKKQAAHTGYLHAGWQPLYERRPYLVKTLGEPEQC